MFEQKQHFYCNFNNAYDKSTDLETLKFKVSFAFKGGIVWRMDEQGKQ